MLSFTCRSPFLEIPDENQKAWKAVIVYIRGFNGFYRYDKVRNSLVDLQRRRISTASLFQAFR